MANITFHLSARNLALPTFSNLYWKQTVLFVLFALDKIEGLLPLFWGLALHFSFKNDIQPSKNDRLKFHQTFKKKGNSEIAGLLISGDFSHSPQHVFWTCS